MLGTGSCNSQLRSSVIHRCCTVGFFRLFTALLCAAALTTIVDFSFVREVQAESEKSVKQHVLILNSYHKGFEWTDAQTSAACEVLSAGTRNLEIYVEYMDTKRLYSAEYLEDLLQIFKLKYLKTNLDAIIATDDNALQFAEQHHKTVFSDAPILFCGINDYDKASFKGMTNCTGLIEVLDIKETLDLAMRFHPGTKRVFVAVDNTPTGMGQQKDVAIVAKEYKNLEFNYLKGEEYSFDELLAKLRTIPDDSIVLLTVWLRDKFDMYISPEEGGALISSNSVAPVYGIIDMYLGRGIVGGKLLNSRTHGRLAAKMALRVLHGERPDSIPVVTASTNPCMFDYKQLKRWGIQVSDLPEESIVLGRPFSVYDEYKGAIYGIMAAFIGLTFLVMVLTANVNSRKRAENAVTKQKLFTDAVLDAQADTFFVFDPKAKKAIRWNKALSKVSGYSDEEIAAKNAPNDWYSESDLKIAAESMENIYEEGQATVELSLITKDGKKIPFEYSSSIIPGAGDEPLCIISVGRDITERKQTEEERLSLERQVQQAQKLESLGVLAGGIAHDFNNILVAVLGYADLALQDMSPHAPAREYIREIEKGARRAADLATQMLAYSGKGRFELGVIDLSEFVEEMTHLLEVSVSKKAILKFNFADNLPTFEGDATQIRQIIMNLITNASEAIGDKSGVICVSTGAMECDAPYLQDIRINEDLPEGMYVYLEVADQGKSI